ncbi:GNAT family N-acetyltransferase [Pedobacter gandavensis]|uniref:GNAT family N-acetyltransferase n=1 Tax=Pedobacter gandavensis TaxID=2679963 RepID=A0ABR6ES50_9SPHI|nr:GNAT family N-acetyltransferase [Pedobacter gandavensis]MBB2148082.1 GNAT family N-acetyltransferase [Pedobacter gandavensis]
MKHNTKNNYSLHRMLPTEWEAYKSIRLEALQTNPEMFGSNYQKEAAYSQNDWVAFLENDARAIFGLYDMESLIGLTGVAIKKEDATKAILFASFIKPLYRGKGLSKLFYEARIDWAKEKKCHIIVVSHRAGNEISRAANQRFGFKFLQAKKIAWPDGEFADELIYALQL